METNKEYLARLLPLLKKPIPSQWRVQSFSKNKPSATVMSYIDQRDLMDVLDSYCDYGWEKRYEEIAGNVFCSIGIRMPDGTIMWRSDCGVESQSDAEKGRASDAAKRAGVNWGVGRFLYDLPVKYVKTNGMKADADRVDGDKVYKRFPICVNDQGQQIWDLTAHLNGQAPTVQAPKAPTQTPPPANTGVEVSAEVKKISDDLQKVKTLIALTAYWNDDLTDEQRKNGVITNIFTKRRVALTPKA